MLTLSESRFEFFQGVTVNIYSRPSIKYSAGTPNLDKAC